MALLAALAVIAVILIPGGDTETGGDFFGMTSFGQLGQTSEAEDFSRLGVGRVRVEFSWREFQESDCDDEIEEEASVDSGGFKNDPEDEVGRMDAKVRRAAEHGLEIIPYLYGTRLPGDCDNGADVHYFPTPGSRLYADYIEFVEDLVQRYGVNGDFWLESRNQDLPRLPIRVWEVWNEPNLSGNDPGGDGTRPRSYGRFLVDVSAAIRDTQEALVGKAPHEVGNRVLFGGVYGGYYGGENRPIPDANRLPSYLRRVYGSDDDSFNERIHDAFDGFAYHPYRLWGERWAAGAETSASLQEGAIDSIREARATLDDLGDGDKELWITEIGWPVDFDAISPTLSGADVSRMMSAVFEWTWAQRDSLKAEYIAPFTYMDRPADERCSEPRCWAEWTGLKAADGEDRPFWPAYAEIIGGP